MTSVDSFQLLITRLDALLATLRDLLQWAVTEGKPVDHDHVLVSRYEESVVELIADVEEARCIANAAHLKLSRHNELTEACRALVSCQRRSHEISKRFFIELVSFPALSNLERLAAEKREPWGSWVQGVKDALGRCQIPLADVDEAIVGCWQEVSGIVEPLRRNASTRKLNKRFGSPKAGPAVSTTKA